MATIEPMERALDVALIVMRNGGSTRMADRTFRNILKGFKQDGVSVIWRLDFAVATSEAEGRSTVVYRPVGPLGVNMTRASEAAVLGERVAGGEVETADIGSEIERINAIGLPYGRWAMMAAAAGSAAVFSQLTGGDWGALGIAGVAGGVGQLLRSWLQTKKLPVAPVILVCGALSACLAAIGLRLGWSGTVPPTAVSSVIYMVPGLPLINGFIDVVSYRHLLVGLERIASAAFILLVLAIALAFAQTIVM